VLEQVLRHFGDRIALEKIDIDQFPDKAREYHVMSVPTFVLLRNGQEVWRYRGFDSAPSMIRMIEPYLAR
jgi:thioredoxin 1